MFRRAYLFLLALCVVLIPSGPNAQADIISNFNANDEGWKVVSFNNLTATDLTVFSTSGVVYNSTGGNPDGYISARDPDFSDFTFSAPGKFLGNRSSATGLSYDLTHPIGAIDYQVTDVILMGNGVALLWKSDPDLVPDAGWLNVSLAFTPSSNWRVGTSNGALATAADFQTVLANLTGLYIRGEYTNGLDELAGLDNVNLILSDSAVPEPTSLVMLFSGVLSLGAFTRWRM